MTADETLPEEWRVIQDFPDYEVSDLGRVRRRARFYRHLGSKLVAYRPKKPALKPALGADGYHLVMLYQNGKKRENKRVNMLVCETFHGPRPSSEHEAAHWDGNKLNNHKANLRWATKSENREDSARLGTLSFGDRHPTSKLKNADVRQIRTLLSAGMGQRQIATQFGVSQSTISDINTRRKWARLS
jgi:HNH endonuclease/Helix-turn-helix domain/NUMOD4 motif